MVALPYEAVYGTGRIYRAVADLSHQSLVGPEKQLLPRLAPGIEGPRHLRATERAVREQPAILARERHPLRSRLVDDVRAQLGEPVDVGLTRTEVSTLHGIVEQPVNAVAVPLVVLGSVDPTLRGYAVGSAGTVVIGEAGDLVAEFGKGSGGRRPGQPRADDDNAVLSLVRGIHQLHFELVLVPPLLNRAGRDPGVENHRPP